jgi:hypothetical protein
MDDNGVILALCVAHSAALAPSSMGTLRKSNCACSQLQLQRAPMAAAAPYLCEDEDAPVKIESRREEKRKL